jgi:hypothetical protein
VVGVRVGDEDGVQPAAPLDEAEVGELVAGQPPARLGRRADAGVDEQRRPAISIRMQLAPTSSAPPRKVISIAAMFA